MSFYDIRKESQTSTLAYTRSDHRMGQSWSGSLDFKSAITCEALCSIKWNYADTYIDHRLLDYNVYFVIKCFKFNTRQNAHCTLFCFSNRVSHSMTVPFQDDPCKTGIRPRIKEFLATLQHYNKQIKIQRWICAKRNRVKLN